jgi:GT2 family glycosyltransferase
MNPTQETLSGAVPLLVSVLLTSFNSAVPLRRALAALEASEARDRMEILVIDGGSRDGSPALDEEFPGVTMMRLPRYFGATKLRNIGVRTAKGEYVLMLSPTVQVRPETVLRLAEAMESNPELGAIAPLVLNESGQPAPQLLPLPTPANLSQAASGNLRELSAESGTGPGTGPIDAPILTFKALLTRRQTIAGMNYLDERFGEYWSDLDLCYKLRRAGKKLQVMRDIPVDEAADGLYRPNPSVARAFAADRAIGASRFAGKHFGGVMGAQLKAATLFKALGSGQFGAFSRIIASQIIDGTEVIS